MLACFGASFAVGAAMEFRDIAKGQIVLLGGAWGSARDFHETPIGRIPGLLVNAFAVEAEINGTGIHESRLTVIFYDIVIGLVVAWIAWLLGRCPPTERRSRRRRTQRRALLARVVSRSDHPAARHGTPDRRRRRP